VKIFLAHPLEQDGSFFCLKKKSSKKRGMGVPSLRAFGVTEKMCLDIPIPFKTILLRTFKFQMENT